MHVNRITHIFIIFNLFSLHFHNEIQKFVGVFELIYVELTENKTIFLNVSRGPTLKALKILFGFLNFQNNKNNKHIEKVNV